MNRLLLLASLRHLVLLELGFSLIFRVNGLFSWLGSMLVGCCNMYESVFNSSVPFFVQELSDCPCPKYGFGANSWLDATNRRKKNSNNFK